MASKFKRELKNVVYNYSDAEAKVREATSNDPWGPSSSVMGELAEYTYHVEAYAMVMGMLWKRLNDHGKNWRHVYKSLVVLEYLVKSGSERVHQQCKENMFSIQTLKDFQYIDKDGKDQGTNIREKAKNLVAILKDENRLKEERERALQARHRQGGIGSDGSSSGTPKGTPKSNKKVTIDVPDGHVSPDHLNPGQKYIQPVEQARPSHSNEEDMQLKLAIQLSKQQAEEEQRLKEQEEESLKAALELSKAECSTNEEGETSQEGNQNGGDLLLDLSTSGLADPWSSEPAEPPPSYDMISGSTTTNKTDPWAATAPPPAETSLTSQSNSGSNSLFDPWGNVTSTSSAAPPPPTSSVGGSLSTDPWAPVTPNSSVGGITTSLPPPTSMPQPQQPSPASSFNPFDLSTLDPSLPPLASTPFSGPDVNTQSKRVEDDFLGDLAQLVNLDNLSNPSQPQSKPGSGPTPSNPFGGNPMTSMKANPFEANKAPAPTLNQLAVANTPGFTQQQQQQLPAPLVPVANSSSPGGSPHMPRQNPYAQSNGNPSYNPFS